MKVIAGMLWAGSALAAIAGALFLVWGLSNANGAPQEASVAATAACVGILPYCLARAFDALRRIDS